MEKHILILPHFTDEELEVQRGQMSLLRLTDIITEALDCRSPIYKELQAKRVNRSLTEVWSKGGSLCQLRIKE